MKALEDFPVKVELAVNWGEMDALGHVNNANYFRYFEASRMRYLEEVGFNQCFCSQGIAAVLSRVSCNFIAPLQYPDLVTIGTRVSEIGYDSIAMEHFVASKAKGLAAIGESELVVYDFKSNKKMAVPDPLKKAIEKLEKRAS